MIADSERVSHGDPTRTFFISRKPLHLYREVTSILSQEQFVRRLSRHALVSMESDHIPNN